MDNHGYMFPSQLKTTFSTDSRVQNMFDILLNEEMETDKREKVSNSGSVMLYIVLYIMLGYESVVLHLSHLGCQQPDCVVKRRCRGGENLPE